MYTPDRRRASLHLLYLTHRYYSEGGKAGHTLHPAGSQFGTRTWATYEDCIRRAHSIRPSGPRWYPTV